MKKSKSSFKGKVKANSEKVGQNSFSYLRLPKGVSTYSPTPGSREKFDILPYRVTIDNHPDLDKELGIAEKGSLWYKRPFKTHGNVGVDKDKVVCLTTFGKKCPICEYRVKRQKEGADKDELKGYNPSNRNLYLVIPKGIKKTEEIPHVFDMSAYLFQNLLNEELEENDENEIFPDLEEGKTLQVRFTKESFQGNTYAAAARIDFLERAEAYDESILDELPDLDNMLIEMSYEAMKAKFFEMETTEDTDVDDDEDDDDVKPVKKSFTKAKAKPADEEDDDDEETPPPAKKAPVKETKKAPAPVKKSKMLTWEDIEDMPAIELLDVIESKELDIDSDDYDAVEDLQKAVAEELGIDIPVKAKTPEKSLKKKSEPEPEDDDDDDDDDDEETPPPAKKAPAKSEREIKSKTDPKKDLSPTNKCPFGHKFGKDADRFDDCDNCKLWDACSS